jgi:hypothetical protein
MNEHIKITDNINLNKYNMGNIENKFLLNENKYKSNNHCKLNDFNNEIKNQSLYIDEKNNNY